MKLFDLQIFFLLLTSATSAIARSVPNSVYDRRESSNKQVEALHDGSTELDTRSEQIVPLVIAGLAIGIAVTGQILHTLKTKPQATIKEPAGDKEPASQLLQESVNWVSSNSDFTAIAVRSSASHSVGFNGKPGQDWGSSLVTLDAADGQSNWLFYWARSGTLTVVTPDLTRDVVLGGSTSAGRDPNNQNQWTFTIIH